MTSILGISAFYHDSAATIIIDGKIIAAAQEERFTRIKHDASYPNNAIEFVLKYANLKLCSDEVRLPLVGVTSETKEKITSAMQHANLI